MKDGYIVKPKFYAFRSNKGNIVKLKGLGRRLSFDEFIKLFKQPKAAYIKFLKFKEAMRRGEIPNLIVPVEKNFTLEDNKRMWDSNFYPEETQMSEPKVFSNDLPIPSSNILEYRKAFKELKKLIPKRALIDTLGGV